MASNSYGNRLLFSVGQRDFYAEAYKNQSGDFILDVPEKAKARKYISYSCKNDRNRHANHKTRKNKPGAKQKQL